MQSIPKVANPLTTFVLTAFYPIASTNIKYDQLDSVFVFYFLIVFYVYKRQEQYAQHNKRQGCRIQA